jgi:hypothetical protein
MNRPEHEVARKLVEHLDNGVDSLEPGVRGRLLAARNAALSHYREKPQSVLGLTWAGAAAGRGSDYRFLDPRHLVVGAMLVLAVAVVVWWQSNDSPANELAEIDSHLLADELPVNAYLDKGFDSWLKRSSR